MQPSRIPQLLALVAFGLSLASGLYAYNRYLRTVPALVAAEDVPAGAALNAAMVRVVRVPAGGTPPQALYGPGQVAGMYAAVPLFEGHILSARQVTAAAPASAPDPVTEVGPDQRVVSVPVKPEAVLGGALRPGDLVDVAAAWPAEGQRSAAVDVILTGVKIVDLRDAAGRPAAAGGPPVTALLLVKETQAKAITAAVEAKAVLYLWLTGREGQ